MSFNKLGVQMETVKRSTLTVHETAKYLGLSSDMVYKLVRESRIPHVRIGRRILFKREAIDRFIDEQIEESMTNEY